MMVSAAVFKGLVHAFGSAEKGKPLTIAVVWRDVNLYKMVCSINGVLGPNDIEPVACGLVRY